MKLKLQTLDKAHSILYIFKFRILRYFSKKKILVLVFVAPLRVYQNKSTSRR